PVRARTSVFRQAAAGLRCRQGRWWVVAGLGSARGERSGGGQGSGGKAPPRPGTAPTQPVGTSGSAARGVCLCDPGPAGALGRGPRGRRRTSRVGASRGGDRGDVWVVCSDARLACASVRPGVIAAVPGRGTGDVRQPA